MRGTALGLGIAGGVIGLIISILVLTIGGLAHAAGGAEGQSVAGHFFFTFAASVVGLVGGGLALRYPLVAAVMLLIACIAGFIAASAFWIPAGIFLFVGALLAFLAWNSTRKQRRTSYTAQP